jgi:hypothetical protein
VWRVVVSRGGLSGRVRCREGSVPGCLWLLLLLLLLHICLPCQPVSQPAVVGPPSPTLSLHTECAPGGLPLQLRASLIGSSAGDGQLRCVFILPEGVSLGGQPQPCLTSHICHRRYTTMQCMHIWAGGHPSAHLPKISLPACPVAGCLHACLSRSITPSLRTGHLPARSCTPRSRQLKTLNAIWQTRSPACQRLPSRCPPSPCLPAITACCPSGCCLQCPCFAVRSLLAVHAHSAFLVTGTCCLWAMCPCSPLCCWLPLQRAGPQLAAAPISNGGTIVRCSKLYSRRVVLVGDAAHSVFPALGQGANSALEGAATLATVLQGERGGRGVEGHVACVVW